MAIERTFSIIKPNAVAKNVIGSIFSRFEAAGFKIVGTKMLHLTCWARPTRQTRWRVPCALTTLTASPRTAPTVPTL